METSYGFPMNISPMAISRGRHPAASARRCAPLAAWRWPRHDGNIPTSKSSLRRKCHGKHGKKWVFAMEKLENITFCHGKHGKIWVFAMENWEISLFAMENMGKNQWFS